MNLVINDDDLKALLLACGGLYRGYTFSQFKAETIEAYKSYFKSKTNPLTFSQWVNGQIIAMTHW